MAESTLLSPARLVQYHAPDNVGHFDLVFVRCSIFVSMLPSVLLNLCHVPCGPFLNGSQSKMAPLDTSGEDLAQRARRWNWTDASRLGENPGCQKFHAARALVPSEPSSHILCYPPLDQKQVSRSFKSECSAHPPPLLRLFPSTRLHVQLTVLYP